VIKVHYIDYFGIDASIAVKIIDVLALKSQIKVETPSMSFSEPDNKNIIRALEKIQHQLDALEARFKESQRLFSPEHIAQVTGYSMLKTDTEQIKQMLAELTSRIQGR
jgi:hypothetical protein